MFERLFLIAILAYNPNEVHGACLLGSLHRFITNLPNEFKCPISLELMVDPVVASDGCTYERDSIAAWLSEHNTSPTTNAPLESRLLFQNRAMRNLIREWQSGAAIKVRSMT